MAKSIKVSPKHGVNPTLMKCFYCGDAIGVALLGRLKDDREAPREAVFDHEPCDNCKGFMKLGVICISVRDGETDRKNPYRTGRFAVVRAEAFIPNITNAEIRAEIERTRVCFITDSDWQIMGLPMEDTPEQS